MPTGKPISDSSPDPNHHCNLYPEANPRLPPMGGGTETSPLLPAAAGTTPLFLAMSRRTASRFTFSFAAASLHGQVTVSAAALYPVHLTVWTRTRR